MADVSGITNAGNYPQPNMLSNMTQWQDLINKQSQNALTKATTLNTQQNTVNQVTSNTGMQLDQHQKRWTIQGQASLALANQPLDQITPEAINTMVDRGVENGDTSPAEAAQYKADIAKANGDPQVLQSMLIRHSQQIMTSQQQLDNAQGQIAYQVDNAGNKIPIRMPSANQQFVNPNAAPQQTGAVLPTGLAPQVVTQTDNRPTLPDGRDNPNYGAPYPAQVGGNTNSNATPNAPSPGVTPPVFPNVRTGQPVPTPAPGPGTTATPAPASPTTGGAMPPGAVGGYSGLPPGATVPLEASSKSLTADDIKAGTYSTDRIPYEQALQAYKSGVVTSPTAPLFNAIKQVVRANLPAGVTSEMVEKGSFDALNKWSTQIAIEQAGAMSSVPSLEAALTGNANVHINENAGADVTRIGLGVRRMQQAVNQQYHADLVAQAHGQPTSTGKPVGSYLDYKREFSAAADPRAYVYDIMSDEQRARIDKTVMAMTPDQLKKWNYSWQTGAALRNIQATPE